MRNLVLNAKVASEIRRVLAADNFSNAERILRVLKQTKDISLFEEYCRTCVFEAQSFIQLTDGLVIFLPDKQVEAARVVRNAIDEYTTLFGISDIPVAMGGIFIYMPSIAITLTEMILTPESHGQKMTGSPISFPYWSGKATSWSGPPMPREAKHLWRMRLKALYSSLEMVSRYNPRMANEIRTLLDRKRASPPEF